MDRTVITRSADALISLLKSSLAAGGAPAFGHLVLYTPFGVVRGRTGLSLIEELAAEESGAADGSDLELGVIELNDATVEHYSNHLATASFERLYVRLSDVQGFALVNRAPSV